MIAENLIAPTGADFGYLAVIVMVPVGLMILTAIIVVHMRRRRILTEIARTKHTAEAIARYLDDPTLAPLTPHYPRTAAHHSPAIEVPETLPFGTQDY